MDVWKGLGQAEPPGDVSAPGCFLWRFWHAAKGRPQARDVLTAQRFANYLQWTWLDALSPYRRLHAGCRFDQGLFLADDYFKSADDALAFRRHMAAAAAPA